MWNQSIEYSLMELRDDAVLIFQLNSMKLLCLNGAARVLFGRAEGKTSTELFSHPVISELLHTAKQSGKLSAAALSDAPWFDEPAVLHSVLTEWDGEDAIALTIGRRAYGPPPEALQMMKAVLNASYFTAIRVDLQTLRASVMTSSRPLLSTQPDFRSYPEFISVYAEAMIHPEDREQFLSCFSVEQLRLFTGANTAPACTVRRLFSEEYGWASFTLAAVNPNIVLLFGKDSNEQQLQKERSDRYQNALQSLSRRTDYILSSVCDIFRLMLHVDLRTGDTEICSMHPGFTKMFSYDKVYPYEKVFRTLIALTYPEDRPMLERYSDFTQIPELIDPVEQKKTFIYRRISMKTGAADPKWTRSVITLLQPENGKPTEMVYTVQDIDVQRRRELEAERLQDSLSTQFYTLIRNRYLWYIDCDFHEKNARCYRISDRTLSAPFDVPFGQFFERIIMPYCHPDDFKTVGKALLPAAAEEAYRSGSEQISLNFRHRVGSDWKIVRAELFFQTDGLEHLHGMLYISDVDQAFQRADKLSKYEHLQLMLRKKFCLTVQESYVRIGEVDLDADCMSHYRLKDGDFVTEPDPVPFSQLCGDFAEHAVYPGHCAAFCETFSYEQILRAQRANIPFLRQTLLLALDRDENYRWCNMAARFFHDENGRSYLMVYVEDVHDDIVRRDAQVHELESIRAELLRSLRREEENRIRKAHLYLDVASSFQLSLNQIYASAEQLRARLGDAECPELDSILSVYNNLTAMTDRAKDILLLENHQLPMLHEPVSLPQLLYSMKKSERSVFYGKSLRIMTFTNHVTEETVSTDSRRLTDLLDSIFIRAIRSLPEGTRLTLQLSQIPMPEHRNTAMYEFSLITYGNDSSKSIQRALCEPLSPSDGALQSFADEFRQSEKLEQYGLYFCKRLISLMKGELQFMLMPDGAGAVMVRLPLQYLPHPVVFPHMFCLKRRAFVWDTAQQCAMATMEMLRETGMRIDWQADFDNLCSYLRAADAQQDPCSLIVLKQTDLNAESRACLWELFDREPQIPIIVLADAPAAPHAKPAPDQNNVYYLTTPLFRSVLAETLRRIADDAMPPHE